MKLRLADYKEGVPVAVSEEYNPHDLDLEFVDLKYIRPLVMQGIVEKGPDTVSFKGELTSETECTCGLCLKQMKAKVRESFDLYYETKGKEVIDTIDDLREVLILDHPISYVCSDTCKGLCPHCGINRNESSCKCESTMKTNAFSELKKIWTRKREE